ncbi:glycosyltransferase [Methylocapsa acidiphila]|uniref:glycosyltransferase n=1 Tax=Methylocapsa acidiphila TaxID=133552 RepID=UPI0003FEF02A|nr:glycosyltransferase [Methylocapsa acidiphila]
MVDVSLIICARNEESQIAACLSAAIENSHGRFKEIIVVDNASTDQTPAIARAFQGVRVVSEPRKGLTYARQCGFENAGGDILAYIDADTRLPPGWLDSVEEIFEARGDVVSLSGSARYFDASPWERFLLGLGWWIAAPPAYWCAGYMVYGAHFAVRRSALETIGGFNTAIDFYGEDTELARRLARTGKTLFRMRFFIHTSARRFHKEGVLRTCFLYAVNFLWPAVFGQPFSTTHLDVRPQTPAKSPCR